MIRKRKKTLLLDQELLERVRQLLAVRTETEAVQKSLESVLRRELQIRGLDTLARLGPINAKRSE